MSIKGVCHICGKEIPDRYFYTCASCKDANQMTVRVLDGTWVRTIADDKVWIIKGFSYLSDDQKRGKYAYQLHPLFGNMIGAYRDEFYIMDSRENTNDKVNSQIEKILKTEYSEEFNALCKNRVVEGFYKYGPIAVNFGEGFTDAVKNIELCLSKIKETGNTEYFCDIANYAMYGWRYPAKGQSFKASPTEESAGRSGHSFRELEQEGYIDE